MEGLVPFLKRNASAGSGLFRAPGSQRDLSQNALWQFWALLCRGRKEQGSPRQPPGLRPAPDLCPPISRHLDISRDRLSSYYKFKLTRKVLSLFVQKLGNLMSLDISGHMVLENCSVSKMDEEAGQTRWGPARAAHGGAVGRRSTSTRRTPLWGLEIKT